MSENLDDLVIIDGDQPTIPLIEKIKSFPMSYYLVAVNVIVFAILHLTNLLIADHWFVSNFAKVAQAISMDHEYYRLFTAIFTHQAPMHLLFNCSAIIILGKPVEAIFGKWKFLLIFLISGLFGSLTSFIFSPGASIGASGGVFGMFGVHLYLYLKNRNTYLKVFGKDMAQLLILNVIIGFVLPNIDYYGHFGGIFGGFLASLALGLTHKIKINKSFFTGTALTLLIFFASFIYVNNNFTEYYVNIDTLIEEFNAAGSINDQETMIIKRDEIYRISKKIPVVPDSKRFTEQLDEIFE